MTSSSRTKLAAFFTVAATAAINWLVNRLLDYLSSVDIGWLSAHRLELSVALASILGVCVGWIVRGVTLSKRLSKERIIEHEAEHDERLRKSIRELDPSIKALMRVTAEYGRAYVHSNDPMLYMLVDIDFYSQFLAVEHVDRGISKITATPALKQVYSLMPELFECVTVTMNEHMREDGERVIARYSKGGTAPDWWWFRPKKKPSQVN